MLSHGCKTVAVVLCTPQSHLPLDINVIQEDVPVRVETFAMTWPPKNLIYNLMIYR